jgi:phage-related minor tail protein
MHDETTSKTEEKLRESVDELDHSVKKLDTDINKLSGLFRFLPTLGRSIISAIGAVIATTIIVTILVYILQRLTGVPIFGDEFRFFLDKLQSR